MAFSVFCENISNPKDPYGAGLFDTTNAHKEITLGST